jgi:small GTP-binding protein
MANSPTLIPDVGMTTGVVKLVVLGDGAVGKTTIIDAVRTYIATNGTTTTTQLRTLRTQFIDFHVIPATTRTERVFSIWDLQGQRLKSTHPLDFIADTILAGSAIIVLMFAVNDAQSFENLLVQAGWYDLIKNRIECMGIPILVVANKADCHSEVIISSANKIVSKLPTFKRFLVTSAITGQGIKELVDAILQLSELSELPQKSDTQQLSLVSTHQPVIERV